MARALDERWLSELKEEIDRRIQPAIYALERAAERECVYLNALREIASHDPAHLSNMIARRALDHPDVTDPS